MIQQLTYDGIWVMTGPAGLSLHNHELNVQQKQMTEKSCLCLYLDSLLVYRFLCYDFPKPNFGGREALEVR
jgi:hypothetical protein